MTTVFFSYSHADEDLRNCLEKHLATLVHQGLIDAWHDRRILGGDEFDDRISEHLERADIVLLLVSSDFLASKYCYEREMLRAMELHNSGKTRVIPVILRHCDWHSTPFGKLRATPRDGKPIRSWTDFDEAFLDVVLTIREAIKVSAKPKNLVAPKPSSAPGTQTGFVDHPRSSNLGLRRAFTDADRDIFLDQAFDYMTRFFENSLSELKARNPLIDTSFKRLDANRFVAVVYLNGQAKARCKIALGGISGKGITFSQSDRPDDSSFNEALSVTDNEQMLCLTPMGMATYGASTKKHMTLEGASEYFWEIFLRPLRP